MRDQCAAYILHLMRAYIENIALPIHTAHTHSTHTHTHTRRQRILESLPCIEVYAQGAQLWDE